MDISHFPSSIMIYQYICFISINVELDIVKITAVHGNKTLFGVVTRQYLEIRIVQNNDRAYFPTLVIA